MKHASLALYVALSAAFSCLGCATPERVSPSASPKASPTAPTTNVPATSAVPSGAPSSAPAAATSASKSADGPSADKRRFQCRGRSLSLQDIWVEECQTAEKPPETDEPPNIELFIGASDSYVSGEEADVGVYIVNRSGKEQDLVFQHQCLGLKAHQMFDLIVKDSRGRSATLEQYKPRIGIIGALSTECEFPYVHATLPPDGQITIAVPFIVAATAGASSQIRPGALPPGKYTVELTAPLVREPLLKATFPLVVTKQ
jgi:hypothetical protein